MELQDKKQHIIRCVKLGMDLESAMFCAECSFEEMDDLREDDAFNARIKTTYALEEYRLLEDHELASKIAAGKGNTHPLEWKLGKINPSRWGNRLGMEDDNDDEFIKAEIYLPSNGRESVNEES